MGKGNVVDASEKFATSDERSPNWELEKEVKKSKKNKILAACAYLEKHYDFRYNTMKQRPEYRKKGADTYRLVDDRAHHLMMGKMGMDDVELSEEGFRNLYHGILSKEYDPIREYLNGIPNWDGKDAFPDFVFQIQLKDQSQNNILLNAFRKWFVGYVATIIDDFQRNDTCFVLAGEQQGTGKTTFIESIVPKQLRLEYLYTGSFNFSKDDHLEMLGNKMVINLDEMATLNRNDIESLKSVMSLRHITLRRAWGKAPIYMYRRASFLGSINRSEFLTDTTGNRRWLPWHIDKVIENKSFNIDVLFAQALHLWNIEKFKFWFDLDEIAELEQHNEYFRRISMEEELIRVNYRPPTEEEYKLNGKVLYATTSDIANQLGSMEKYKKINVNDTFIKRLGMAFNKLDFPRLNQRGYQGKKYPVKVYAYVELSDAEKEAIRSGKDYKGPEFI